MATTRELAPAEVFPVGEYLADELEARGWTIAEFASIIGRPTQAVSEIVNGHKSITAQTAFEIGAATGTDPQTWLNLQGAYEVWRVTGDAEARRRGDEVRARGRMAALVPVNELRKRGVITGSRVEEQAAQVCSLLGIENLDQTPAFDVAARSSVIDQQWSPAQRAWIGCVLHGPSSSKALPAFDRGRFIELCATLTTRLQAPEDFLGLPEQFARVGVRLVHVPAFKGGKIDGVAYLDDATPVIGISARIPFFDAVAFTVLHECAHIALSHVGLNVDIDLVSPSRSAGDVREREADEQAATWAVPEPITIAGALSRARVEAWAAARGLHPAIVVGRLHHEGRLPWSHLKGLIPNVREFVAAW